MAYFSIQYEPNPVFSHRVNCYKNGDFHDIFIAHASQNHKLKRQPTPRQFFDIGVKFVRSQEEHMVHVQ